MSGKKKQSDKKKIIEKKTVKEEVKRKLIPFTAGKLPSVSKSMPQAAGAVPLVSKEVPLVSKPISLVSAKPNISIPRYWEKISSNKKWNMSSIEMIRRRKVKRPKDIGVFKALGGTIISPVMGTMKMVKGIASAFRAQAEEERQPNVALEQELLQLKMRREMSEISEEDYRIEESKLKKRIKGLEEKGRKKKER